MKHSLRVGFSFGVTSGIITTLGLIIGLNAGTHSKLVVIGGILTIAIADAFSDALGIHISEESENIHSHKQIWIATLSTFISKAIFALSFVLPVLLLNLPLAVVVSIAWGLFVLAIVSYHMGKDQKINPWKVVFEHLLIAIVVILITHQVGTWISQQLS